MHATRSFAASLAWFGALLGGFVLATTCATAKAAQPAHTFEARDHQFLIDGKPAELLAGEMHFGRVQPDDWETRIKQAKAMGLNTISFYLFWNQCEPEEGKFNFTGMTDVRRVIKLCQENGLWVILRPGPYCCAEIEYGGIPYWTLKHPEVKIRTDDPRWLDWCRKYLERVYQQVGDLQVTRGGPVLMVQIENEIGITNPTNNNYMVALAKVFKEAGFDTQLFTCDPTTRIWSDPNLRIPGVMPCRNGLKTDQQVQQSASAIGDYPVYVPEVYTAWFSGWGEPIAKRNASVQSLVEWATYLLDRKFSFCFYMFFGGSNYGFDNGCNENLPVQTSYDYGAPIDEAGRTTEKYQALRKLISGKLQVALPEPPPEPPVIELPTIRLDQHEPLIEMLPPQPSVAAAKPVSMENLNQACGFVLYRKRFENGLKGMLELRQAMDYTVVMVNGRTVAKAFAGYGPGSNKVQLDESGAVTLDLLVYNLGRISVVTSAASQGRARKGLIDGAYLDGKELNGWQTFSLPMDSITNFVSSQAAPRGPAFYRGTFTLEKVGGTFLDLRNWSMGVVWINGHNLGRFWDRAAFVRFSFRANGCNGAPTRSSSWNSTTGPTSPKSAAAPRSSRNRPSRSRRAWIARAEMTLARTKGFAGGHAGQAPRRGPKRAGQYLLRQARPAFDKPAAFHILRS